MDDDVYGWILVLFSGGLLILMLLLAGCEVGVGFSTRATLDTEQACHELCGSDVPLYNPRMDYRETDCLCLPSQYVK